MRHAALSAALVLGIGLAACEVHPSSQPVQTPTPSPDYTGRETQPQPVVVRYHDCGDGDAPCVTYDDGDRGPGIYLVITYDPFKAYKMPVCDAEDYPNTLPCVRQKQDAKTGEWLTLLAQQ